jgi:hypothetical protein
MHCKTRPTSHQHHLRGCHSFNFPNTVPSIASSPSTCPKSPSPRTAAPPIFLLEPATPTYSRTILPTPTALPASPPGFDVANYNQIFPIAHGKFSIPNTQITLDAFVFHDDDLHSNLFGIAPLTQHGLSATYTNTDLQISATATYGPKIIIYGVKNINSNVWLFSLPKAQHHNANQVVRHEQHAELVLYASATFGSPPTKTFYNAVANGWLTNYPTLTPEMIRKNQPHSPATALGHITIARSGIQSSQPKAPKPKALATTRSQASGRSALPPPLQKRKLTPTGNWCSTVELWG